MSYPPPRKDFRYFVRVAWWKFLGVRLTQCTYIDAQDRRTEWLERS